MVASLAGLTGCSSPTMATMEEVAEEEKETENQPQTAKDLTNELENNLENELENNTINHEGFTVKQKRKVLVL